MKVLTSRQLQLLGLGTVIATALTIACSDSKNPNTPTSTTTTTSSIAPALAAPTPQSPTGGTQIQGLRPTLEVENAKVTGNITGSVTYRFQISESADFPDNSRTLTFDGVAQGGGSTSVQVDHDLIPNLVYYWHARATNGTITSDWSGNETLKTENRGFKNGANIYDPLTNGQSVGNVIGGQIVIGKGWRPDNNIGQAIDYDIPTTTAGSIDFDVTGVETDEPGPYDIGMKFFSMGDGSLWDFAGFRNQPFKVSLDKKSGRDFPGENGVVEHIFRVFDDDNRTKTGTRTWHDGQTYHISMVWGRGHVHTQIDNDVIADEDYGGEYAPPNHRISLGCRPRGETLYDIFYSNVRIQPR